MITCHRIFVKDWFSDTEFMQRLKGTAEQAIAHAGTLVTPSLQLEKHLVLSIKNSYI